MSIIEAAKSGKPFKRPHHKMWNVVQTNWLYSMEDILSDDWEIQTEWEDK